MIRYSSLNEVDTSNVQTLAPIWTYNSGDTDTASYSQIQCNPLVINNVLYGVNPRMKLFALDAESGEELWVFDPLKNTMIDRPGYFHGMVNSRGLAYWSDGKGDKRIFFNAGANIVCIDAQKGTLISSFGNEGMVALHENLGKDYAQYLVIATSPGIVFQNLLIIGTRVNERPPAAPGHIRAYDVKTGEMVWRFHTIPQPGEEGYETWDDPEAYTHIGGANAWSGFSLDVERELLFVPLGSASYDFYGGKRTGQNLFANCLVALEARTGKKVWHYQTIHHDVWDKDLPTPPALVTLDHKGRKIDAVAQPTKNGYLFVLNRETGEPIYEVEEINVDSASTLPGEKLWPTQPIPTIPKPYARQSLSEEDINPYITLEEQSTLRKEFSSYRKGNPYLPPGLRTSVIFPGFDGGAEWGGPAYDPETGFIYINTNEMAWIMTMLENDLPKKIMAPYPEAGKALYSRHCSSCHRTDKAGASNVPTLIGIESKYSQQDLIGIIGSGRNMMPAFKMLSEEEKEIISYYLRNELFPDRTYTSIPTKEDTIHHVSFVMDGYRKFLTEEGLPGISPPWGTMNAIDLNTGESVWKIPFGNEPALEEKGITGTGAENYGGPVVTAGGLVFIAAAKDGYFRAYNKFIGQELWKYKLPAPGFATPAIYEIEGRQYIVIACGGGKLRTVSSDQYVAFALGE
jgi:quinoprotein glucose dehydrogenase